MDFVREIKQIYEDSFSKYIKKLSSQALESPKIEIEKSFLHLDQDLSDEALSDVTNIRTMSVAMSGK